MSHRRPRPAVEKTMPIPFRLLAALTLVCSSHSTSSRRPLISSGNGCPRPRKRARERETGIGKKKRKEQIEKLRKRKTKKMISRPTDRSPSTFSLFLFRTAAAGQTSERLLFFFLSLFRFLRMSVNIDQQRQSLPVSLAPVSRRDKGEKF